MLSTALLITASLFASSIDVYCDPDTRRALGVVERNAQPPALAGDRHAIEHRDSADADIKALQDAAVPLSLWRCSPDFATVVRMTPEEAAALPAPGAEARAAAMREIERSLTIEALLAVLVEEIERQGRPAQSRPPRRTLEELRAAALAVIETRIPDDDAALAARSDSRPEP